MSRCDLFGDVVQTTVCVHGPHLL